MSTLASNPSTKAAPEAFLIVQRGSARMEVIPLNRGSRITVGRSPTNRIVVNDGKCSRQHCEVFSSEGDWYVRDLGSRNGITIDGQRVQQDWQLEFGQQIGVGSYSLTFTQIDPERSESARSRELQGYAIIERKSGTRFDTPLAHRAEHGKEDYIRLFQLARTMQATHERVELSRIVLQGLLDATHADCGAVLLSSSQSPQSANEMELVSVIGDESSQVPVSDYLTEIVLGDREGLLAHNVGDHSVLRSRESLRELSAESVICVPIRQLEEILGVIHLYSRQAAEPLTVDDLEFTLALADQFGVILKLIEERSQLEAGLHRAARENAELREQLEIQTELVGQGSALERLRRQIAQVAPTDATVLIRGESGVGKELVARAIHQNSLRRGGPFICVNCAALSETLLESELFGHEKGAFTGASMQRAGKFEQAHQGTLFLDEIGEMSPEVQAKFLRVLEGQSFERVGGGQTLSVDVRVVTATNSDLEQGVKSGKFRSDLYYRLQVIEIVVPPLREHPEDIPEIAQHFVERFSRKARIRIRGFNHAAVEVLCRHHWPGNVRELRNVVERAVILGSREMLGPEDIHLSRLDSGSPPVVPLERPTEPDSQRQSLRAPEHVIPGTPGALLKRLASEEMSLDDVDRLYIQTVLDLLDWNKSQASKLLGIERTTLDRRLKKYGLHKPGRQGGNHLVNRKPALDSEFEEE